MVTHFVQDSCYLQTVLAVSLQFPAGDCSMQVWLCKFVAFSWSITVTQHWYCFLFYAGKNHILWNWNLRNYPATEAAVFGVWLITRELINRKFSHNCGYNVIAKKAAVTSATISYKMEEMHDSLKFKYKQVNVSLENDEGVKNPQLPVIVPKEILESTDIVPQVYFSVVNVLWSNFLTFRQVILGSIFHHYSSLYWHCELMTCSFMDSKLIFLLFKLMIANTLNLRLTSIKSST